nr:leucyl aminopeptidase [Tissierella sp.]
MEFVIGKGSDIKAVLVYEDMEKLETADELFQFVKEKDLFKGKCGEVYGDFSLNGGNILLVGLGKQDKLTTNSLRKSFFKAAKELARFKVKEVEIQVKDLCGLEAPAFAAALAEGLLQSEYTFDKYKTEKKETVELEKVYIDIDKSNEDDLKSALDEVKIVMDGVFLSRDLVNERAINMYPEILANSAKEHLEPLNVEVEIFGKEAIKEIGMTAFLAVAEGSDKEPKFIVMTYLGDPSSDEKTALVGKGLTYDSGGYSLKPTANSMDTMYCDMGGSGTVIGAMKAIAGGKLKKNVVGIVAACENMISGGAYKPGDIISSMSGKTIEVLNTDAEGRITLADALWYAATVTKADKIIDLATLTGACVVALGDINTGAVTNNDELMKEVKIASEIAGEPVWELPNNPEYEELIKSEVADVKNIGSRGAGTITAGLFLKEFVDEKPWVHLDIAGTAYISKALGYLPKGATGVHVKTLYHMVKGQ